jgi:hypothetical protein
MTLAISLLSHRDRRDARLNEVVVRQAAHDLIQLLRLQPHSEIIVFEISRSHRSHPSIDLDRKTPPHLRAWFLHRMLELVEGDNVKGS